MAKSVTKNTRSKIFTSFLLASFILSTPITCLCVGSKKENTENTEKTGTQETDGVKAVKKVGLYAMGTAATANCLISLAGLYIFLTSLKDIKNSATKNAAFAMVKKAIHYFSSAPQFNKYIIPGIIFALSTNSVISLVASVWSFSAAYKTKINVLDYAKFTLLPKLFTCIKLK